PHRAIFFDRAVSDIRGYEFGTHREDLAPPLDPPLGITPVTFRGESDLRERIGVVRFRADDLHLFCSRRRVGGVGLGYAAPKPAPTLRLRTAKRLQDLLSRERTEVCVAIV